MMKWARDLRLGGKWRYCIICTLSYCTGHKAHHTIRSKKVNVILYHGAAFINYTHLCEYSPWKFQTRITFTISNHCEIETILLRLNIIKLFFFRLELHSGPKVFSIIITLLSQRKESGFTLHYHGMTRKNLRNFRLIKR